MVVDEARTFSAAQRKQAAKSGAAMPDGSFPIYSQQDLKNAIGLAGNAKDPAAARRHIRKRARALGLTKLIPDSWSNSDKAAAMSDITLDERHSLVREAVHKARGPRTYVADVADDWLVFGSYSSDEDRYRLYRVDYSMSGDKVTVGDSPEEVRRRTVYVPAETSDAALLQTYGISVSMDTGAEVASLTGAKPGSIHGMAAVDLPHPFTQDEASNPWWCSTCGRSKPHPLHEG